MAHVAPTSHRRATRASHRGDRTADGPIQTMTWLGLTFALIFGLVLIGRAHVGVHAAGVTLLVMLVPLTIAVFGAALRRGLGSGKAALSTALALAFVIVRFLM
ncbi:hypothetical protein EV138_2518 [Kribbella voronezhensis]|uniref:Uncharacterized protein n=1 Tax=Kribbella voronezhensis TaxID=2512212 RepID=A0A4R7TAJ2_9ACTN|nr:hypothetical protein [Kribbella voronezhensis]TDU88965.1 hypothetical protein EV138_2518 [Kribbella voronezhensis]